MNALFPISLNNEKFGSDKVIESLSLIHPNYEKIIFIIADQLQLYNKAIRVSANYSVSNVISEFRDRTNYLSERTKWLEKLKNRVPNISQLNWEIIGVDDISDSKTFTIFRNVIIAFYSDDDFARDIIAYATQFVENKKDKVYNTEKSIKLSIGYILEEIALNIRLKVCDQIYDEYYMGKYPKPIWKLFANKYNFTAFDLAEIQHTGQIFRLFRLDLELNNWTELTETDL